MPESTAPALATTATLGSISTDRSPAGTVVRQKSTSILMTVMCGFGNKCHCAWFTRTRLNEELIPREDLEVISAPAAKEK